MGVEDKVGQHAMEAAGKSKVGGIKTVPTVASDPPRVGPVKSKASRVEACYGVPTFGQKFSTKLRKKINIKN